MSMSHKVRVFWPLLSLVVLADCTTKELAVEQLNPAHVPHDVLGSALRFTLTYNRGTAFGIDLGPWTRPVLILGMAAILVVLAEWYRRTPSTARLLAMALALIAGGAVGNLLGRLRSARGVVDFIDVGMGMHRFWTFNVADAAITVGAVVLALALSRSERQRAALPDTDAMSPSS